jgi:hypothetical protein
MSWSGLCKTLADRHGIGAGRQILTSSCQHQHPEPHVSRLSASCETRYAHSVRLRGGNRIAPNTHEIRRTCVDRQQEEYGLAWGSIIQQVALQTQSHGSDGVYDGLTGFGYIDFADRFAVDLAQVGLGSQSSNQPTLLSALQK